MDTLALGAAAAVMVTVLATGLAILSTSAASAQMRGRLQGVLSGTAVVEGLTVDPLRASRPTFGFLQSVISGTWLQRVERDLQLADSRLHPVDFFAVRFGLAGVGLVVPFFLLGGAPGFLLGLLAAAVGFQAPQVWVSRRIRARHAKLEAQLPEALSLIANSLRAGFGLLKALSLASEQLEHPISSELGLAVHETSVGSSTEEAFLGLSERNASYDLDLVVTAVLVQRSTGGNLSEVLDTVANTMRERVRIRGEISTLTAQQSLTGIVIGMLPVAVGGLFFLISPDYIQPLFTETMGRVMLGAAVLLETVGILIIRRILDIEV